MLGIVRSVAPLMRHFVAGEREGPLHFLVGHPPVAAVDVQVARAIFQEDANRLGLVLANQRGIVVTAAEADVRTDRAEHAAEGVGPFPGGRERADRAARSAADRSIVALFG